MLTALIVLLVLTTFAPIFIWWGRNVSRVFFKREIAVLTDWLKGIFVGFWAIAIVLLVIVILISRGTIAV